MEQTIPSSPPTRYQSGPVETSTKYESAAKKAFGSGVSWAAVMGGAFVTAALSLILLALGTGVGFSSISIWSNAGASASTIGMGAAAWLILMQIISSSTGGYLAGRLRTRWATIHTDEVYFRDTAHGFLAWAVAIVITSAFLTSAAASMAGARTSSSAVGMVQGVQSDQRDTGPTGYFIDMLFRSDGAVPDVNGAAPRGEAERIFVNALRRGEIPPADKSYLAHLVVTKAGLTHPEADKRVSDVFIAAQQSADTTRKVIAHSLLYWLGRFARVSLPPSEEGSETAL